MDQETIELIKRTVAKDATNDELKMFINQCNELKLDPLAKEIFFVKYPNNKKPGEFTVSIQVGIDGYMKVAHRHADFEGIIAFAVCSLDTFEIDAQKYQITHKFGIKKRGGIIGAWAQVNRKGMLPFIKYVTMDEFFKPGKPFFWENFPTDMIEKTAKKKALKMAYGLSGINSEDEGQTSKMMLPTKEEEKIFQLNSKFPHSETSYVFDGICIKCQKEKKISLNTESCWDCDHPLIPEKTKTKSKKKKTSKKKALKESIISPTISEKDVEVKFITHEGERYYYKDKSICMNCQEEKLVCGATGGCYECDSEPEPKPEESEFEVILGDGQEELVRKDRKVEEEPKPEPVKPKKEVPTFSFMKKKKKEEVPKEESKGVDFKELLEKEKEEKSKTKPLNFSLEFQDSLDEETKLYKGDDWYCSSTAKKQLKKDLPLTTFIVVVTQTFPTHADAIAALFKEQMSDKKRTESLLFIYYNALRDYLEIEIKEDDKGVDLLFAQRIARIIKSLYNLTLTGTIEEMHTTIKDATDWKDDWVKWALKFLKARGHI